MQNVEDAENAPLVAVVHAQLLDLILRFLRKAGAAKIKYIVEFLVRVMDCEDLNKMTSSNLAIVFGPNFLWSRSTSTSLEEIAPINAFVDFVLQNHKDIYLIDVNQRTVSVD